MRCPVAAFASLVVVGVPRTQGQTFVHFDIGSGTPSGPASPSTILQGDMVTTIVDEQLALQTGPCASLWASGLSSQCPAGSVMALKGYGGNFGLVPLLHCKPAGCLHAQEEEGGRGKGDVSRDMRDILREAVAREVSMLVEEQPGTSFEKHLSAMQKRYVKEGAKVNKILSTLLREASLGKHTATTVQFFAEMASYRGFAGAVVHEAWTYLHRSHREEMVLALGRRTPKLLVDQVARTFVKVGRGAKKQDQIVTRQQGVIDDLQAELASVQTLLAEERNATAAMRVKVKAAEEATAETRSEVDACLEESRRESARLRTSLFAAVETQEISAKEAADVAIELADVQTLLAEERNATAAMRVKVKAAEEATAETRLEVDACLEESRMESARLHASLFAAVETQAICSKETAYVAFELDDVHQLLAEERINATAAAKMAVKAAEKTNAAIRGEADASIQAAQHETVELRAAFSAMMKQQEELSAKEAANVASELADVHQFLAEERTATATAAKTIETLNAHSEADRVEARAALEKAADTEMALLAKVSSALKGEAAATSELAVVRAQLLAVEMRKRKVVFAMSESADTCHRSLDAKEDTIEQLKRQLKDERTGENAQRGWRLARTKVMDDLDACTVRAGERLDLFDQKIEEIKVAEKNMSMAEDGLLSLQKEVDTCEEKLTSLLSSNDQCDCSGMEVPATADGGSDSMSGAPTP